MVLGRFCRDPCGAIPYSLPLALILRKGESMKRHLTTLLITIGFITAAAHSQTPIGLEGKWEGALVAGPNQLRLVLNITRASDGIHLGTLTSVDQGGVQIPMDSIQLTGDAVRLEVKAVNGVFQGTLNPDKKTMKGTWTQGGPVLSLEFTRTADVAEAPKPPDPAVIAAAAANNPFGIPLEMTVPVPPTPFQASGKTHLVYELHVTNFSALELFMNRLEVLSGDTVVASFEGAELNSMLQRPGVANVTDNR